jgi:hypothetical protein
LAPGKQCPSGVVLERRFQERHGRLGCRDVHGNADYLAAICGTQP